ncbi:MAG: ABC transporter substrate-binding protein, partial [Candidatus Acidiferrales bacterium]
ADAPARPRVLCLEWLDPPFVGGHWVPEMVERAGGQDVLGRAGEPSFSLDWEKVLASQPEVVIVLPCGYGLPGAVDEFKSARLPAGWKELPAVRAGRVYAVDATRYFSRPGPQLATGVELLGKLLHPDRISASVPDEALARLR